MPSMREMEVQAKTLAGVIKSALAPIQQECETLKQANVLLRQEVEDLTKRLDEMPDPRDGDKGDPGSDGADGRDGQPGKSAYDIAVERGFAGTVDEWLESIKGAPGEDGRDGADGADGRGGKDGIDGVDGKAGEPGQRGDKGDPGQDGVGIAETLIDREGELVVTLTNGETKRVGIVTGKDGRDGIDGRKGDPGDPGEDGRDGIDGRKGDPGDVGEKGDPGADGKSIEPDEIKAMIADVLPDMVEKASEELTGRIEKAIADIPEPKDGRDGLGFDDMRMEYDGERRLSLVFERGEDEHVHQLTIPALIDRGVWKQGDYEQGDVVTHGGSIWIARRDTSKKPGADNDDWRLSVKRGRDGKDGKGGGEE